MLSAFAAGGLHTRLMKIEFIYDPTADPLQFGTFLSNRRTHDISSVKNSYARKQRLQNRVGTAI